MAAFIKQYLCCCLPQAGSNYEQHAQQDERQPLLLNPDILPSAPSRPALRTTEQQQAEQDQLRHILHLAEQRLLSVESSAAFRQPDAAAPAPSRLRHRQHAHHPSRPDLDHRSRSESSSTTTSTVTASRTGSRPSRSSRSRHRSARRRAAHPGGEEEGEAGSPSTSRHRVHPAAGDEGAGPLAPIRVVHLDRNTWTELEPVTATPGTRKRNGRSDASGSQRPASSHSMKTLPRSSRPTGLSAVSSGEGLSDELTGEEDGLGDEEEDEASTDFGTVDSYRTAREGGWLSTRRTDAGSSASSDRRNGRRHARDLWSHDGAEATSRNHEELSQAIERLEQEIETWTLPDHDPFVADLGKSGKNAE